MKEEKNVKKPFVEGSFDRTEYDKHMKTLRESISGCVPLLNHLERHQPQGEYPRVPLGLIKTLGPKESGEIVLTTFVSMRPAHLVLSDETAESFNIFDFMIGNVSQNASGEPIPLNACAIKYYASSKDPEKLLSVQDWGGGLTCTPAMRIRILIENITDETREFRGILWSKYQYP